RGRVLATLTQGDVPPSWSGDARIGLARLLGGRTKQLMVAQYSGGPHCCYTFRIYDLFPHFRLVFDSSKYPVGDYRDDFYFLDVNGDGVFEFTQDILTFADDFEGLPNISSPRIPMLFRYSLTGGRYRPANHQFSSYALMGIEEEIREIDGFNDEGATDDRYLPYILDIVLRFIYVGKETIAWRLFNQKYRWRFLSRERLRSDITRLLRRDRVYRFIYGRGPRLHPTVSGRNEVPLAQLRSTPVSTDDSRSFLRNGTLRQSATSTRRFSTTTRQKPARH
ncbi:MAG TPA: hypothetical protein VFV34_25340, partial [Blastocatellia bacterium]|nr:hypothetical protein [Blastocatellia bacterium]